MKTDEEILKEYLKLTDSDFPPEIYSYFLGLINRTRKEEPRINSGAHLYDYFGICDEDDDMDSFYGLDYFKNGE